MLFGHSEHGECNFHIWNKIIKHLNMLLHMEKLFSIVYPQFICSKGRPARWLIENYYPAIHHVWQMAEARLELCTNIMGQRNGQTCSARPHTHIGYIERIWIHGYWYRWGLSSFKRISIFCLLAIEAIPTNRTELGLIQSGTHSVRVRGYVYFLRLKGENMATITNIQ